MGVILLGILIDIQIAEATQVEVQEVKQVTVPRKEVKLEVVYNWDRDRIIKEIRATFPESPDLAVAIATEEGGLLKERQSDYHKDGVRERSFCTFQIHEPSWHNEAVRLGYGEYKTNPLHCIKMARHIYKSAGNSWGDWSAYNNGAYKRHL